VKRSLGVVPVWPELQENPMETSSIALNVLESTVGAPSATEVKYGEREISEGKLITFPNPRPGRLYSIKIALPEFTCKCPFSGYPDFATIQVTYAPNERVVELKALKLYINGFRDRYISHEESVNQILDDLVAACDPIRMTIRGDFLPRGNVSTVITVRHNKAAA
jgi:7-cyano-7-deazaguanine reductase